MKLLIHDLRDEDINKLLTHMSTDIAIISDNGAIKNCIGCFNCWVKTPGTCIIKDAYSSMGELISKSEELLIITKCTYGGYSPFIKNIMDRSISYVHPYFTIRDGEMHHRHRYEEQIKLRVYFYGENITENEKNTAKKLVKGNSLNFNIKDYSVDFYNNIDEMDCESLC